MEPLKILASILIGIAIGLMLRDFFKKNNLKF